MATAYFLKELIDRKLFLPNGAPVPFEPAGQDYGVLQTSDPYVIAELTKAVKQHIGGVIAITEAEFSSWSEKKTNLAASAPLLRERESLGPIPQADLRRLRESGLAAVVGPGVDIKPTLNPMINSPNQAQQQATSQKVEPLTVPTEFKKPNVGKVKKTPSATP